MAIPIIAAAGALYGAYAGERGASEQRKGVRRTQKAQAEATNRAASEQRKGMLEEKAANRQNPDITGLLDDEQMRKLSGPATTLLAGLDTAKTQGRLRLGGESSLLG